MGFGRGFGSLAETQYWEYPNLSESGYHAGIHSRASQECKQYKKNLLAFCAAFLCILIGYLAKKKFQKIFPPTAYSESALSK